MEKTKEIGIWIRVSTEDQAQGESPEHHEKRARLYAEAKGWEIKTAYHLEALSGKSVMGYAETKRMLEDIRSGFISGLVFSKLARLARNAKELLEFADIFKAENADLISLQESIDTSTPAGRLFYTMIAAMAQWEREEISDRVIASIPIRAKLGKNIGGQPSLGYKWEGKEFVTDEQFAPVRKLMYELFLKYKRKKTVARMLHEQGYRTRSGNKFTDTTISRLLRDATAKGERRSNFTDNVGGKKHPIYKPISEWVVHPCPAIVSEELWNDCNTLLDQIERKQVKLGPQPKTLLAGFVECMACEKKMYVYHKTQSPSYTCSKCKNHIHVDVLDNIYKGELREFLLTNTSTSDYLKKINSELQEKETLLATIREERNTIKKKGQKMVDMRVGGEWSKEMFIENYKPIEERIKQIDDELPRLESDIDYMKIQQYSGDVVLSEARDLYARWDLMEPENRRTVVEVITDTIRVGKQDVYIKLSYLPTKGPKAAKPSPNAGYSEENPVKGQHVQKVNRDFHFGKSGCYDTTFFALSYTATCIS